VADNFVDELRSASLTKTGFVVPIKRSMSV
jgi:hypothetical protein